MSAPLSQPLPIRTLYQFPKPSWIENLAIRSNGQLLLTCLSSPELYLLDPSKPSEPVVVHSFTGYLGLLGITEVEDDVFYVGVGNFSISTFDPGAGSHAVWQVDMRPFSAGGAASVKKVTDIPEAILFNGLETLLPSSVLVADCIMGSVWSVDTQTGKYELWAEADEMKKHPEQMPPIGINGLKVHDGYLYWTNSSMRHFCRLQLAADGKPAAATPAEIVHDNLFGDDFVFDAHGHAWLAQNIFNTMAVFRADGQVVTVAGVPDQLTVAGPTACRFGRRPDDAHILYVATCGGLGAPINGTETEGAKVIAIDTKGFGM